MVKTFLAAALLTLSASAAAQPTERSLVETVDISGLAVSPDGTSIAFRTEQASIGDNSYQLDWHVISLDGAGGERVVGDGGGALWSDMGALLPELPVWSPDSHFLYYRALVDGAVQVWRTAADGSGARAVIRDDGDVLSFTLSRDGRSLSYRAGATREAIRRAERAEYDAGVLVDASIDPGQSIFRGAIVNGRLASQRLTGSWFARGGLLWDAPIREMRLDLESLEVEESPRFEQSVPESPGTLAQVESERTGAVVIATGEDGASVLRVRRADGSELRCDARACIGHRIVALAWHPFRDWLLFTVSNAAHAQSLFLWNVEDGPVREIARSDGLMSGSRDPYSPCAFGEVAIYCVAASAGSPPRIERIGLEDGARSVLFDPNANRRDLGGVSVEQLRWGDETGAVFTGKLYLPPRRSDERLPFFVNYYACPGYLRGGQGDEWPLAPMAAAGIAALCIDAPRGGDPHDAVRRYNLGLSGVRSAIDLLASRGIVDPARVGMGGLSFGAEVAMWTAKSSDLIAAVSIASGLLEPGYYWLNGVRGRDNHANLMRAWGLGAPDETPERWRLLSPALNVEHIRAPVLMQLPEQEGATVRELYARLTHSPTPTELYLFPHEPHIKVQPRHIYSVNVHNLDWFRFWLQGYVDPDPAKAEQYRRWYALGLRRQASSLAP